MERFTDAHFIISAWRQLLETLPPSAAACYTADGTRPVTVTEVLAVLSKQVVDTVVLVAINRQLTVFAEEAVHLAYGRFEVGLRPALDTVKPSPKK